jgi:hypothetical protein
MPAKKKLFIVVLLLLLILIFYKISTPSTSILDKNNSLTQSDLSEIQLIFLKDLSKVNINSEVEIHYIKEIYEIAPLWSKYKNESNLIEIKEWRCSLTRIERISNSKLDYECRLPLKKSSTIYTFTINSLQNESNFRVGDIIKLSGKIGYLYVFPTKEVAANLNIYDAIISKQ